MFRVWGLAFRVSGLGFRDPPIIRTPIQVRYPSFRKPPLCRSDELRDPIRLLPDTVWEARIA